MAISNETRKNVIMAYENGHANKNIAHILNVNISSVYAIIKVYLSESRINKKTKGGTRIMKMATEHIQSLQNWIDDDCSVSLEALKTRLMEVYSLNVSIMTISRYITEFNYTLKRTKLIPSRRIDDKSIDDRETYALQYLKLVSELDDTKIYFVDEVGFHISMRSSRGRSLRGTNAAQIVRGLRSRNISVCCSMSKLGIAAYHAQTTAFNIKYFSCYIQTLLEYIENESPGKSAIIMDNVPFHKNLEIKNMIEAKGHMLLFLPPYSPFLNPIENMFSKWKQVIKSKRADNEASLFELINNVK